MKVSKSSRDKNVSLKLDISKTYDRIDWLHLKEVMLKMDFGSQWVRWIMICVETIDNSVIVNNDLVRPIIFDRRLRQGDPFSSYLFIMCAEGLSTLIQRTERRRDLHGITLGITICTNPLVISHLLFADDCFSFFRAEERETKVMKNILATYELASRQAIGFPKFEVYYSSSVHTPLKDAITTILRVRAVMGTGKYLGLQSMAGRSEEATFGFIKDQISQVFIKSWKRDDDQIGSNLSHPIS